MGFFETVGLMAKKLGEMSEDADRTARQLDIYDLCEKVNNLTALNPLLLESCKDELEYRCKRMSYSEVVELIERYSGQGYENVYKFLTEVYDRM